MIGGRFHGPHPTPQMMVIRLYIISTATFLVAVAVIGRADGAPIRKQKENRGHYRESWDPDDLDRRWVLLFYNGCNTTAPPASWKR